MEVIRHIPKPPQRPADGHKGTFGTVIVVGGCESMMGAPALCATAACRSGVGLVKIAAPHQVLATAIAIEPSATGIIIGDDIDAALHQINESDPHNTAVLAIGPGLGKSDHAAALVLALLAGPRQIVLDADGLNILAQTEQARPALYANGISSTSIPPTLVMTPHPGEYNRLAQAAGINSSPTDENERPNAANQLATFHEAVVLLKGKNTIVSDTTKQYKNTTGNVALATAGSGDILTGVIASLIAQGMTGFDAACLGAYAHGKAADIWTDKHGDRGLTAQDLAQTLPQAFKQLNQD